MGVSINLQSRLALRLRAPQRRLMETDERGKMNDYVAWFDGACEPVNPGGTATSGAIVKDKEGTVMVKQDAKVEVYGPAQPLDSHQVQNSVLFALSLAYFMNTSPHFLL